MENVSTINTPTPLDGRALSQAIANFKVEFNKIRSELRDVQCENTVLKEKLAHWRSRCANVPQIDVPSLRRQVAYYCHPDRGGSTVVMSRLNFIFDYLTLLQKLEQPRNDEKKEGAVQ